MRPLSSSLQVHYLPTSSVDNASAMQLSLWHQKLEVFRIVLLSLLCLWRMRSSLVRQRWKLEQRMMSCQQT